MSQINVLWVVDHLCYDGNLHGGGRLYWNVVPRFDPSRFRIVPCILRTTEAVRSVFESNKALQVKFLDKGKYDLTTLLTFLQLIKKENIHVMHLHCYGASTFGRLTGLLTGVPTIIQDYDTQVYFPYPCYLWVADRLLAPITRKAFATSPMVRDYMINRRKINKNKVSMMFHAIPEKKFIPPPRERLIKTRKNLCIDQNFRVIGTVTKLDPQRGNEQLLRAAQAVLGIYPKTLFLIIYMKVHFHRTPNEKFIPVSQIYEMENMLEKLRALVKELAIENNVRFIESWDNLDEIIPICDLIVAPFLSERFSSVNLLEAMAMGKPIIATNIGEQREIIKNGVNGYLVSPGDIKELSENILKLLTDSDELHQMSLQAKAISKQYSVDACVQALQKLYSELATGKPSRSKIRREQK